MSETQTLHIERYFVSEDYMKERFRRFSRQLGFRAETAEDARAWQVQLRGKVAELLGLPTMIACPPDENITERVPCDGYERQRIEIRTEPGVVMPFYALIPNNLKSGERRAAVIAPHGHGSGGKFSVAGRTDIPVIEKAATYYNYAYGVQLAREGFIVFCPDARGFGERREKYYQKDDEDNFIHSSCEVLNHIAIPLGQTVAGMWTWDLMRLADYVSQRPDCDPQRIGCAGLSGGGLQTLYLCAMDERIRCGVCSGYFYGVQESLLEKAANCSCNYVPHLWEYADMGDLAALIAPRPFLIETGTCDSLNGKSGVDNVLAQVKIAKSAYTALGAGDRLYHDIFEGEHRWHGVAAVEWLKKWLA
jgi:dienelactone hydrolase